MLITKKCMSQGKTGVEQALRFVVTTNSNNFSMLPEDLRTFFYIVAKYF